MRISLACLLALVALPAGVLAQDAPVNKQVHDTPAVRGSIIANLLQDLIIPSCSIPTRATICSIHGPAISIKKRFAATTGLKTRVKTK